MKKIIALVFAVVTLGLCLSINIAAEQPKGIVSVGSAQGSVGETVTITVYIKNNPGIVSMYLDMEYDTTRLALVSAEDQGLLKGKMFGQSVSDYPYALTWDDSAPEEAGNNTKNGALVTLTFQIRDDAPLGDAEVRLKNSNGIIDFDLNNVEFAFSSGKITVTKPESEITAVNMELGDDVTMNYYAKIDSAHAGAAMRFTMNGTETLVAGEATENSGIYVFPFCGVAPQCMGDRIDAELVLGDEVLDVKANYSVRAYCDELLAKNADELEISESKFAALKVLVADMLEYGAMAQIYNDYKTAELVNAGIGGKSEYSELEDTDKAIDESGVDGLEITGVGMYFDYVNSFYVNFTALDYAEDEMCIMVYNTITDEECEYTLADCILISEETGEYVLVTDAIFTTSYNDLYFIELYTYSSRGKLMCQQTLEYSVASYVYAMQNKTDAEGELTPMAKLARAVYLYGNSAAEYKAIVK